ncbi:uncharacterized protein THITE_2113301 [Thermothielavioides terrestris NRRL 8126]|jgi:isopentenyl diphosphate isomerase/L-lactate dehydrogenase-like FMN-dependent dehydrogenase|uniref:FMN hydroxy acid dehydrogenase domain-containing protein n=1 Tax=Thermothielavioides terrestris (strain ATCC 38088 / NRRL 8126) TaxID=578455 RepID=G2R2E6_THETT|nr:uncharacterized protein THITE_2113301 [Thermothielavioides terrestris NRRL 8126]AEO65819.1 hypothetical protein THITE_2113301 [Thermothielavioides terrestris NRRL 8126]
MAPVGVQTAYHEDGEKGVATACASLGVPFIYSTAASTPLEAVAEAADRSLSPPEPPQDNNSNNNNNSSSKDDEKAAEPARQPQAPRWFQLYWPLDDTITASLLSRARVAGCSVLVVTLDTFTLAWRPLDLDAGYLPFARGEGNALGFSDPVFRKKFADQSDGGAVEDSVVAASRLWASEVFSGHAHRWEDLATLRRLWGDGPIVLKGVLSVQDAEMAVRYGMNGIIVSNHGGRQLDGAVPSLEMLPEIVDAVGDRLTVLFDSGIRTGTDVMKALALGAKAVLVGRPVIYGLGAAGSEGARHVLASLLADLDQSMGLAGVQSVGDLNRAMLRRINYGGDFKPLL